MNNKWIVEQIEKALKEDDDKLRVRLEVLVDMLTNMSTFPERVNPLPFSPPQPLPTVPSVDVTYESEPLAQSVVEAKKNPPKESNGVVKGAGSIISNGEQINYSRPPGT